MISSADDLDGRVRLAAFTFLDQQTRLTPDGVLTRAVLAPGFTSDGTRIPHMTADQAEVLVQWFHHAKAEVEGLNLSIEQLSKEVPRTLPYGK